jgi:hypothetical protein
LSECPSLGMLDLQVSLLIQGQIFSLPVAFSSLIFTNFKSLCFLLSFASGDLKKKKNNSLTEYSLFFFPFFFSVHSFAFRIANVLFHHVSQLSCSCHRKIELQLLASYVSYILIKTPCDLGFVVSYLQILQRD